MSKEFKTNSMGINVIKYEGDNNTFVWKHPVEDFNMGTQLIVHESQEAIFFLDGQALDTFGPGRYTLETQNLPILSKFYKIPTGGVAPFHCEVYFINKTVQMGIKWGTDSRVRFIEPQTGIPLDIGASGELNLQVFDARKLLIKLVGTTGGLHRDQLLKPDGVVVDKHGDKWETKIRGYFRPLVMTTVKANLSAAIKSQNINILEIDEKLEILSAELRQKVSAGFEEYGLFVPQLFVTNVSLPENDPNFARLRKTLAESYLGVREAEVKAEVAAAQRQEQIERSITDLELARIKAEKEKLGVDVEKYRGFAKADVMHAQGYDHKDELAAEVQKAYAEGIGNMGSNGGGNGGGSMMGDLLGLGVAVNAMNPLMEKVGGAFNGFADAEKTVEGTKTVDNGWKCSCGAEGNKGKFCAECGSAKPVEKICPKCGAKVTGKFCAECGSPVDVVSDTWDCACGKKGLIGKFCDECGAKKED
ncbi:MAG: SPFH domain-containing protein [Clostridia bacterium]|nr:SPFH domain-containing protein [Clostridia bacterium]